LRIIVSVKRVPDTEARIRIAPDGVGTESAGLKFILNPYDEFAVEAALRQREALGAGDVTVLTVGAEDAAEALRAGLAMGADQAVHLATSAAAEGLAVARAIADELRERPFDLALFGVKAIDDDLQAVGVMVGELLDLPTVSSVSEFTIEAGTVTAHRMVEGGIEVVDVRTPCVLTITKGAYEPRYPSLKGIMAAKKKPVDRKDVELEPAGIRIRKLEYPPERQAARIVGEGPDAVPELVRLLREEARVV